ncbi:MAG: M28 family peptidase, partial [Armatimonadota bacterium]
EEIDRRGSKVFVKQYLNTRQIKPRLYINIDSGVEASSCDIHIKIHPKQLTHDISALFTGQYAIENEIFESDDSVPFSDIGTPVFWVWARSPQRAHSIYDTVDNVDVAQLNNIAKLYSKAINQYIGLTEIL